MNKILFRLWGLPPSISVRVPNGRRLQEGLKVPFSAGRIFRQRDFLLVEAKHMILSVIFKINQKINRNYVLKLPNIRSNRQYIYYNHRDLEFNWLVQSSVKEPTSWIFNNFNRWYRINSKNDWQKHVFGLNEQKITLTKDPISWKRDFKPFLKSPTVGNSDWVTRWEALQTRQNLMHN